MWMNFVVEGDLDKLLLEKLLEHALPQIDAQIMVAGGAGRISVVARTLLLEDQTPLVVLMDADQSSGVEIDVRRQDLLATLSWGTAGVPKDVIFVKPAFDVACLLPADQLEVLLNRALSERETTLAEVAPSTFWETVGRDPRHAVEHLTPLDLDALTSSQQRWFTSLKAFLDSLENHTGSHRLTPPAGP